MADRTLNVLCICGSLRKASYNRMVMNALPALAPENMKLSEAPSFAEFLPYNVDVQEAGGVPPAVQKLADAVRAADGVIFNSPEYNFSIPGGLKNALDWLSRVPNQPFAGKPVAIQSAANGTLGGGRMQYDLRRALQFLDARTLGKPEIFIGNCSQKIDAKTGEITDQQTVGFHPPAACCVRQIHRSASRNTITGGDTGGEVMGRLDGRVAIVTGGAKGIGRHYSRALAAEGARVMIADIADGGEIAAEIARAHGANSVASSVTDVSDESAVKALAAKTVERFGRIDILVNNAALFAPLQETNCFDIDVALWDRVMAINLRGPFLMMKHVAPHMIAQGYGKIINIGSGTAYVGIPMLLHYVTSKGGVMAFTRAVSRELGVHGIRVNTLMPGFTMSDTVIEANPGHVATARPRAVASRALKRDEQPEDLLGTLIFLASADSDFITGQNIAVDGGNVNT